jgi:hypothetical protein
MSSTNPLIDIYAYKCVSRSIYVYPYIYIHIYTGTEVVCPPQTLSLTFNEAGKVVKYTGGYVMDKTVGNSGGLGGEYM